MNKKKLLMLVLIGFLFLGLYFAIQLFNGPKNPIHVYNKNISEFYDLEKLDINEWNGDLEILNNSYIYFGRSSCSDCQKFIPKLKKVLNRGKFKVFYVDTEEENKLLQEIRDNLAIDWVPTFGFIINGKLYKLNKEKNISEEDIMSFILENNVVVY
jgi:predicted bacteriocin transport accessory protein